MDEVGDAYDAIAPDYHAFHPDWRASVVRQGRALARVLAEELGERRLEILDCSCGIGTQAIGLALAGHEVVGTDLSVGALDRAESEAASFGVRLETEVADMRDLSCLGRGPFDAVISCDNSVAHLTPAELAPTFEGFARVLRPGGRALVSLRDYGPLREERPTSTPVVVSGVAGERSATFQIWEWDGVAYDATLMFLTERGTSWATRSERIHLHAHLVEDVATAFSTAGLIEVRGGTLARRASSNRSWPERTRRLTRVTVPFLERTRSRAASTRSPCTWRAVNRATPGCAQARSS